ncbi:hypothetical protein F5X98DRAFT_391377 [Xylaria grammica]|nr:hypothetical protein F5X98DRAFT_391377 [Xylaria grammica]
MSPNQLSAVLRPMSHQDWNEYRGKITHWYINENMTSDKVMDKLEEHGFIVKKHQLVYKIRAWGLKKNLTGASAAYLNHQFEQRQQAGKETTALIAFGTQWSDKKVKRALRRHVLPKWRPDPVPDSPKTRGQLVVFTPPEMSADRSWEDWPETSRPLPFISFRRLAYTLKISAGSLISVSSLRWTTSVGPTFSRYPKHPTSEAVAALDRFVPEAFPGDNLRLAESLTRARVTRNLEIYKLIIFELSNNPSRPYIYTTWEKVMGLCSRLGLTEPTILNELCRLAPNERSILAAVHTLFVAACSNGSADLVSAMIWSDRKVNNGTHICLKPSHLTEALKMAIKSRNLSLIKMLLSPESHCIIQEAVQIREPANALADLFFDESMLTTTIVRTFLSSGINFHGDQLLAAITGGNLEVFDLLVNHAMDINHQATGDHKFFLNFLTIMVEALNAAVAAVICSCHQCRSRSLSFSYPRATLPQYCRDCEALAKEMLLRVCSRKAISVNGVPAAWPNVLIIAAARGFNDIIHLFDGGHETLDKANKSGLWPLCAAVISNHLDTCRLLLQMGADPNYRPPTSESDFYWLSPLHQAASLGHTPIARELVKAGAFIEHKDPVDLWISSTHYGKDESCPRYHMSPLEVAIQRENKWSFEFFISCGAQLIVEDSYPPDRVWSHVRAGEGVTSKKNLSVITRCLLTASCKGSTELLSALRKCVDQIAWAKAWSEALGIALECSQSSILAFLLQAEVSREDLRDSWPLILQEATYYFHTDTIAFIYEMSTKFGIPDRWLPYAAGALPTEMIRQLFPQIFESGRLLQQKTLEGKSCLEMAMLNHHSGVPQFFLQLLPREYDSGALCVSVLRAARLSDYGPVHELLNRRRSAIGKRDAILENTAIGIAGYYNLVDIIVPLLEYSYPADPSVTPESPDRIARPPKDRGRIVGQPMNSYVRTWTAWRTLSTSLLRSPLFLATANRPCYNRDTVELMMEKGYQCDTPLLWTEIALECRGEKLISLVERYNDVNSWISYNDAWYDGRVPTETMLHGPTALHRALLSCRLDMARLLIDRGADVNQQKLEGAMEESFPEYSSCLQIAARKHYHLEEEAITLLLSAGADVNAPASWNRGATALQFVVMEGDLALARRLINQGASINAPRALYDGRTCLEGAAENGKLDMVQYLLNAGVDTEGTGRVQYIYATVLAEAEGYWAIVETLRTHRKWDSTDEALFEELRVAKKQWRIIIIVHPEEHPAEEFVTIRSWCRDHEKDFSKHSPKEDPFTEDLLKRPFLVWPDLDVTPSTRESLYLEEQESLTQEKEDSVMWEDWLEPGMLE